MGLARTTAVLNISCICLGLPNSNRISEFLCEIQATFPENLADFEGTVTFAFPRPR